MCRLFGMTMTRDEVLPENRWNVEALFPDLQTWNNDFHSAIEQQSPPHWPSLAKLKGKLGESPATLKSTLEQMLAISRKLSTLYTWAHLRHDEDIADNDYKTAFSRITTAIHQFHQETSWFEPELLSLPQDKINEYLNAPLLEDYRHYLESILRVKEHTLSPQEESILARAGQALQTPNKAFSAINDADFKFGTVKDGTGEEHPLTHGTYMVYIRDKDAALRKNTFEAYHKTFNSYQNTIGELLSGQVQKNLFNARCRKYSGCLEAALTPHNIPVAVYQNLVDTVNRNLGSLHKYMKLKKRALHLDELHLYDLYVPLIENVDIKLSYDEAVRAVSESVSPLGGEYQKILTQGLNENRWVDRYENQNKRSGAYSSGCYDSMPYILMNYKDLLRDVFTLAHEAGHSMHSYYSRSNQPYHYSDYSIFVAEVASTFNEELLMQHLLKTLTDKESQIFLLNQKLEDIRATLFRQTMFAEFELLIHELAENYTPLTPALLTNEYQKLNKKYFGPDVAIDEIGMVEWARIPHFYYNFYVYQYATGISAALALADRVTEGGEQERQDYISFLKLGSSHYPIDSLRIAGVDMQAPQPIESAISKFDTLVDKLSTLI
jgi:oligoendopeptidase F